MSNEQFHAFLLKEGDGIDPIHRKWPIGTKVKGIVDGNERLGVVVEKPLEEIKSFGPSEVPVKWDCNKTRVSRIYSKYLQKV